MLKKAKQMTEEYVKNLLNYTYTSESSETFSIKNIIIKGLVSGPQTKWATKVAVFGSFQSDACNKIDYLNKTIVSDAIFLTSEGDLTQNSYQFEFQTPPQKALLGSFKVFAFNDMNRNNLFDEGEDISQEGNLSWPRSGDSIASLTSEDSVIGFSSLIMDFVF
jgi:hypothetical protein